jgi:4-hydroxybenzoyl-CoA thioesterase
MDLPKPHEHEIRVTWGDCDPARIAYTARFTAWALDAINAWWEAHLGGGWYEMEFDHGFGTPFVHMSLDFRSPVTPRHRLNCKVWPAALGSRSITFGVEGYQDGTLCFEGKFTSVFIVAGGLHVQHAPDHVRAIVEPLVIPDIEK